MRPLVIDYLEADLFTLGRCNYCVTDTEYEFAVRRLPAEWEIYTLEIY